MYLDMVDRAERAMMGDQSVLSTIITYDFILLVAEYREHQREIARLRTAIDKHNDERRECPVIET